jgi:hypothetical protein
VAVDESILSPLLRCSENIGHHIEITREVAILRIVGDEVEMGIDTWRDVPVDRFIGDAYQCGDVETVDDGMRIVIDVGGDIDGIRGIASRLNDSPEP